MPVMPEVRALMRHFALVGAMWMMLGCGSDDLPVTEPPPVEQGCPPGTHQGDAGDCELAGIPADRCAEGFAANDRQGCDPLLPAMPCLDGLMAVPGDAACAPPGSCGAAPFGDGPFDAATQYVDASYAVGDSDGSAQRPWTSIQQGVDAAASGSIVAIAGGDYLENVSVSQKTVRLWGRCATEVRLTGNDTTAAALSLGAGADQSEVRGLSISGPAAGLYLSGSSDVLLAELWIHDTAEPGLWLRDSLGPASASAERVLLERAGAVGASAYGSSLNMSHCVVRDTRPSSSGDFGWGISIEVHTETARRGQATLSDSLLERNVERGLNVLGSDTVVEGCVIRDTESHATKGTRGIGVYASGSTPAMEPSRVQVRGSSLTNNHTAGVYTLGGEMLVAASVVAGTQSEPASGYFGRAITGEDHPVLGSAELTLEQLVVEGNREVAIAMIQSNAMLQSVLVRDTISRLLDDKDGDGLLLQRDPTLAAATATVVDSVFERNRASGILNLGGELSLLHSVVRDTQGRDADKRFGRGIIIQNFEPMSPRGRGTITNCLVERNHDVGISVTGSDAIIDSSIVRDTLPHEPDGLYGDGIAVYASLAGASARVTGSTIEGNARVGLATWESLLELGTSRILCNAVQLNGEGPFEMTDLGDNDCGCGDESTPCQVVSSGLSPPPTL